MTDQTPNSETKRDGAWREWLAIGVGLTGLLSVLAVIISVVALSSSSKTTTTIQRVAAPTPASASATPPAPQPLAVNMKIKTDVEHGKKGPDGQWHDAFLGGDFSAQAGQTVKVTVLNYDDAPHSFTAPALGLNVKIAGGSAKAPHATTFTFKAPSKAGTFQWFCALPCDPWAMSHDGFMRGHVTITA